MRVFAKLRALAETRRRYLPELRTTEDEELVREIGHHQVLGAPLTLKQVMRLGVGSAATAQRRLARLKRLGLVRGRRSPADQRVVELTLSAACMRAFLRFDEVFASATARGDAAAHTGRSRHACSLCEDEQSGRKVIAAFLAEGLRLRERCMLFAPAGASKSILHAIPALLRKRLAADALPTAAWPRDPESLLGSLREAFANCRKEHRGMRAALAHGADIEAGQVARMEREIDRLIGRYGGQVLCQYDVTRIDGAVLLSALRSHPDLARLPYLLG